MDAKLITIAKHGSFFLRWHYFRMKVGWTLTVNWISESSQHGLCCKQFEFGKRILTLSFYTRCWMSVISVICSSMLQLKWSEMCCSAELNHCFLWPWGKVQFVSKCLLLRCVRDHTLSLTNSWLIRDQRWFINYPIISLFFLTCFRLGFVVCFVLFVIMLLVRSRSNLPGL